MRLYLQSAILAGAVFGLTLSVQAEVTTRTGPDGQPVFILPNGDELPFSYSDADGTHYVHDFQNGNVIYTNGMKFAVGPDGRTVQFDGNVGPSSRANQERMHEADLSTDGDKQYYKLWNGDVHPAVSQAHGRAQRWNRFGILYEDGLWLYPAADGRTISETIDMSGRDQDRRTSRRGTSASNLGESRNSRQRTQRSAVAANEQSEAQGREELLPYPYREQANNSGRETSNPAPVSDNTHPISDSVFIDGPGASRSAPGHDMSHCLLANPETGQFNDFSNDCKEWRYIRENKRRENSERSNAGTRQASGDQNNIFERGGSGNDNRVDKFGQSQTGNSSSGSTTDKFGNTSNGRSGSSSTTDKFGNMGSGSSGSSSTTDKFGNMGSGNSGSGSTTDKFGNMGSGNSVSGSTTDKFGDMGSGNPDNDAATDKFGSMRGGGADNGSAPDKFGNSSDTGSSIEQRSDKFGGGGKGD